MWLFVVLGQPLVTTFDVELSGCAVDVVEVTRLTSLELASAGAPTLRVRYACQGTSVTIGLSNAATGMQVARVVGDACCAEVETERTFALLARGLFTATREVLTTPPQASEPGSVPGGGTPPAPTPPGAPAPTPPGTPAPMPLGVPTPPPPLTPTPPSGPAIGLSPATTAPSPPVVGAPAAYPFRSPASSGPDAASEASDPVHVLGLSSQLRAFNLDEPALSYGVGLDYRAWVWPTVAFGGYTHALFGAVDRVGGQVETRVIDMGVSAAWRFARLAPVAFGLELRGGLSIAALEGVAATPEFEAASVVGATGHLGASFVPEVVLGGAELALPLGAGALFRAPRGRATSDADEDDVQLDGVWVGGALRVSLGFGARPRRPATWGGPR